MHDAMAKNRRQRKRAARRRRPRRLALLRRRQHPGRDRAKARRFAPDRAAPGLAGDERAADQGPARSSDRALHGTVAPRCDSATICSIARSRRPIRPRPPSTLGIAQIAAAEMERWLRRPDPDRHRHRHRAHDARGRRPDAGDAMSAAQAGRARRHRQGRRLGLVLRRHHPRLRHGARAALSDAAAGASRARSRSATC